MAYIGASKAQYEAQKYQIDSNFAQGVVSTVANTTLQVGQELVEQSNRNKLKDLNNKAYEYLQTATADIYNTADPESYQAEVTKLYDTYADTVLSDVKVPSAVAKEFRSSLTTGKSQAVVMAHAKMLDTLGANRVAVGTSDLDKLSANPNPREFLQKNGYVAKGATSQPKKEETSFSDSFIGNGKGRIGVEEEKSETSVLSPELQAAYEDENVSDYDLSVMAVEHIAKEMHPHNEAQRKLVVEKYTQQIKESMPMLDLQTNFNKTFSRENYANWDYDTFAQKYAESLKTDTYGGDPLSETKQNEVMESLHNMWNNLQTRIGGEAQAFYEESIQASVQGLKTAQVENSNEVFVTDDINKIYDDALEANPMYSKFLTKQKENDLTLARNNERILMQSKYKNLYSLGGSRTSEQNGILADLTTKFTSDELNILKKQSLVEASELQSLIKFEASGVSFQTQADQFKSVQELMRSGNLKTTQEIDAKLAGYAFDSDQYDALRAEGVQTISRQNQYKIETANAADNFLAQSRMDKNLKPSTATAYLDENNIDDPKIRESVINAAESFSITNATNEFYEKFQDGAISEADFNTIINANEITDQKYIAGLKEIMTNENLSDANNEIFRLINSEEFSGDGLQTILEKFNITNEQVKNSWQTMLDNHNLSTLVNKYESLDKDGNLSLSDWDTELEKSGVDYEKNASALNAYRDKAKQNSLNNATKELGLKSYMGTLSKGDVAKMAADNGLTKEENPEFFKAWEDQAKQEATTNAQKTFTSLNFDDSITIEQVDSIASTYGIGKDNPLYKQMKDIAEVNWDTHLEEIAAVGQGFAKKSNEEAIKGVNSQISDFSDGKTDKSSALTYLKSQKGNLSETDYKKAYNDINNEQVMKKAQSDAIFESEVYRPYLADQKFIMPGETDKRLEDAGLNPLDYADNTNYLQMRDTEAINQHVANVEQYSNNQMFLALRERGLDDMSIKELGFDVPDITFQHTIEWATKNPDTKPITTKEYAEKLVAEAEGKMVSGTLPSGRSIDSSSTPSGIKASVSTSADRIKKNVDNATKIGGKYDNPSSLRTLNLKKYELGDEEYDALAYKELLNGNITEDTYRKAVDEDTSAYKSPQYKKTQDALKVFSKYIEDQAGSGIDKKGKTVTADGITVDIAVENYKAAFLQEYEYAVSTSNGAPVDPSQVAKRVYDGIQESKWTEFADSTMSMVRGDATVLYTGLFNRETDSKKALTDFQSGMTNRVNGETLAQMLSDPSNPDAGLSTTDGMLGTWITMGRNGRSEREVGNQVAYDLAKWHGMDVPDIDSPTFEADFDKMLREASPVTRAQWEQSTLISKWLVDITEYAKKDLPQEVVDMLAPEGNITPIIEGNRLGVAIGDTKMYFSDGGSKAGRSFEYIKADKNGGYIKTFAYNNTDLQNSKNSMENSLVESFTSSQSQIAAKYKIAHIFSGDVIKANDVEGYLEGLVANKLPHMAKKEQQYISALNTKSLEIEALTGNKGEQYSRVEYGVDSTAIQKAIDNGTIRTTPLNSFITYKAVL